MDRVDNEALRAALSEPLHGVSIASRLRAIWPELEAQRVAGVPHMAICEALNEAGWHVSLASYRRVYARLKKTRPPVACTVPAALTLAPVTATPPALVTPAPSLTSPVQTLVPTNSLSARTRADHEAAADELIRATESRSSILDRFKR